MQHTWRLQKHKRSHTSITSHNHGGSQSAGVFRVSTSYRKHRKHQIQLPLLPCTKNSFNEQLHVPSGDPCCHESCSISVPFHPALLLQTWHSLFLPLLRGRARHCNFNFSPVQMLSLLWLKSESNLRLYKFPSLLWDVQRRHNQKLILMLSSSSYINSNGSNEYYMFSLVNLLL